MLERGLVTPNDDVRNANSTIAHRGASYVHMAIRKCRPQILDILLKTGADPDYMGSVGRTYNFNLNAAVTGCSTYRQQMLQMLLQAGADPNLGLPLLSAARDCRNSELSVAAIRLLYSFGADVNARAANGATPLWAFGDAKPECIPVLNALVSGRTLDWPAGTAALAHDCSSHLPQRAAVAEIMRRHGAPHPSNKFWNHSHILRPPPDQNLSFQRGTYWIVCNTNYELVFQDDGNLVLYRRTSIAPYRVALWNSVTTQRGSVLAMQNDGNLVIYDAQGRPVWGSATDGNPGAYFALQPDGNLVIYSRSNQPIWSSGTHRK